MTYVPPEKKQKGGTSGFGDFVYVMLFILIEGLFIFLGIPLIIFAIAIIPVAMYLVILGEQETIWPLYVIVALVVFFQILGVQFFVRKWILEPNKMTFGQWLRWRFSPKDIRKRREERRARSRKMDEWYDGLDRVKERRDLIKDEQSYDLRSEWYKETGDPEILNPEKSSSEGLISLGDNEDSEEIIELSTESITLGSSAEEDSLEITLSDDTEEEKEETYSWE